MSTSIAHPPAEFLQKMQSLFSPSEYGQFLAAFDQPYHTGLRVNTLKLSAADFSTLSPFPLLPAGAYEPAAFEVSADEHPGRHPYHDAGLYYLQEPSAMVAAALLAPQPDEWVLDIAAAPGGKSTHLSSLLNRDVTTATGSVLKRMKDSGGLLVANDIVRSRASILAANLARWGASNQLVTADEPERLTVHFGPVFDRVLVDAPCSGEGMFRKQGDIEWSERMVLACAVRQDRLLATAAQLVRPGGRLLYATCTFSPEEDEVVIGRFLAQHDDFELIDPPHFDGFAHGRPEWVDGDSRNPDLARAVRLWPYEFPGEGHFMALLQRSGKSDGIPMAHLQPFDIHSPLRDELRQWHGFAESMMGFDLPEKRLHAAGGRLFLIPAEHPAPGRLHLVRYGIALGELHPHYFRPSADLALALQASDTLSSVSWKAEDPRLQRYRAGEDNSDEGPGGWVLVCVDGFGLGWAKRVNGRLKNHFPRSSRRLRP